MKKILVSLGLLLLFSCSNKTQKESPFILLLTVGIKDFKTKEIIKKTDTLKTDTFTIGLHPLKKGKGFSAYKQLDKKSRPEGTVDAYTYIVDANNKDIIFNGYSDFTSFMTKKGYEITENKSMVYYSECTLQKIK